MQGEEGGPEGGGWQVSSGQVQGEKLTAEAGLCPGAAVSLGAFPEADRLIRLDLNIEPLCLHPLSLLLCSPLSIRRQGAGEPFLRFCFR